MMRPQRWMVSAMEQGTGVLFGVVMKANTDGEGTTPIIEKDFGSMYFTQRASFC
jgi:hypothetical protein